MNNAVFALAVDSSDNLYAGGSFTTAGGVTVNRIAKWNGTAWSALGSGLNSTVNALAVDSSDNVYMGGLFNTVTSEYLLLRTAKWNGSSFEEFINVDSIVNAIIITDPK